MVAILSQHEICTELGVEHRYRSILQSDLALRLVAQLDFDLLERGLILDCTVKRFIPHILDLCGELPALSVAFLKIIYGILSWLLVDQLLILDSLGLWIVLKHI